MEIANVARRGRRFWICSLLLLALLLTVTPVVIVIAKNQQQTPLLERDIVLLQDLDRIDLLLTTGASDLSRVRVTPEQYADIPGADLAFAKLTSAIAAHDSRAAIDEIDNAQRLVRLHLSMVASGLTQKGRLLKILLSSACLLSVGLVFVLRGFRQENETHQRMQESLQHSNQEVLAALDALRNGADAKSDALIHVSESLRDPLDGMIRLTGKLLETRLTADQRQCAQSNLQAALTLGQVVRDIHDFALMESGRLDLEVQDFRPSRLIEETLETFRLAARHKGLQVESVIPARFPDLVRGDPRQLQDLLTRLLDNAVKFTQTGGVTLTVSEFGRTDQRVNLRFEIRDTGPGIADDIRGRLFEPLRQSDRSKIEGRGAGLGLAICKRLVEMMSGEIDAVNPAGKGTMFWFTVALEVPVARTASSDFTLADGAWHRRTETRQTINYPTLMRSKVLGVALVRILDLSGFGLRVTVPFRLPVGTEVEIRIDDIPVRGLIRYCICVRANEFYAGIELLQSGDIDERGLADFVKRRNSRPVAMVQNAPMRTSEKFA